MNHSINTYHLKSNCSWNLIFGTYLQFGNLGVFFVTTWTSMDFATPRDRCNMPTCAKARLEAWRPEVGTPPTGWGNNNNNNNNNNNKKFKDITVYTWCNYINIEIHINQYIYIHINYSFAQWWLCVHFFVCVLSVFNGDCGCSSSFSGVVGAQPW